jgi:hypothetical protein
MQNESDISITLRRAGVVHTFDIQSFYDETRKLLPGVSPEASNTDRARLLVEQGWTIESSVPLERTRSKIWAAGSLWHLRVVDPKEPLQISGHLEPRLPARPAMGEDKGPARVSLAPTPGLALRGLALNSKSWHVYGYDKALAAYTTIAPVRGVRPSLLQVPDLYQTLEVWSFELVEVKLMWVTDPEKWRHLMESAQPPDTYGRPWTLRQRINWNENILEHVRLGPKKLQSWIRDGSRPLKNKAQ